MITIYSLSDPFTNDIFYVGKTSEKLRIRLSCHITKCRQLKTPTHHKIYEIISKGLKPTVTVLQSNIREETREDWRMASKIERRWINYFITDYQLTNIIGVDLNF